MVKRFLLGALLGALALGLPAAADTVTLKDGTVREGEIIAQDPENVTLSMRLGGLKAALVIPRAEILTVQVKPVAPDPVETEAAKLRKEAEGLKGSAAADAWVKLGDLYARQVGYSAQARAAYEKAIEADPEHTKAHHNLGHVKTEKGWQKVEDERRGRGLVPLGEAWVKPDERTWLIDRRHAEETEELRIGPRQADKFTKADIEKALALKRAEEEAARREQLRLAYGDSLLSRWGYFADGPGPYYIGSGATPYWWDGVGYSTGNTDFFAGTVGSGWGPYGYGWGGGGGGGGHGGGHGGSGHSSGFSPGLRWGNFQFGTSFNMGSGWGGGWGATLQGGGKNFRYNIGIGGFSGSSSFSSSTGLWGF
jgi:hypothetical protein